MQMIPRAVPRTAHIADDLPLLHPLAGCDTDAGAMGVQRVKRSIMLYLYVIPIACLLYTSKQLSEALRVSSVR